MVMIVRSEAEGERERNGTRVSWSAREGGRRREEGKRRRTIREIFLLDLALDVVHDLVDGGSIEVVSANG